jgi:hypothetical protein
MKSHWTPTYIFNRISSGIYWKLNQDKPWLTKQANDYLEKALTKQMIGLEFGSGRSTIYFSKKLNKLVSVENHKEWYLKVQTMLKESKIDNVGYYWHEVDDNHPEQSEYHKITEKYEDNYFDFILIDGRNRDLCALGAIPKLKSKGLFVIDNVNRYIPNNSIAPESLSKNSAPLSEEWATVINILQDWDTKWSSNGVTDTAIFIKP